MTSQLFGGLEEENAISQDEEENVKEEKTKATSCVIKM